MICAVPFGVTFCRVGVGVFPPPHAIGPVKITDTQSRTNAAIAALWLRCLLTANRMARAKKPKAANGTGFGCFGRSKNGRMTEPDPVVVMVRLAVAVAPFGVICAGLKLQFAPAGSPVHESEIALLTLGTVATVIANIVDPPAVTVAFVGDEDTVNGAAPLPTI